MEAIRAMCIRANDAREAQAGRDAREQDRSIGIRDVLLASEMAGRTLAVQNSGRFMELRQDELEEEEVWDQAFVDPDLCWDLHHDNLEAQSDETLDALAELLAPKPT